MVREEVRDHTLVRRDATWSGSPPIAPGGGGRRVGSARDQRAAAPLGLIHVVHPSRRAKRRREAGASSRPGRRRSTTLRSPGRLWATWVRLAPAAEGG